MAKRREPWDRLYDTVRVVRSPDSVCESPPTGSDLDAVEAELGSRLPHSYRAFLSRFGPGELHRWVRLNPLTPRPRGRASVVARTRAVRDYCIKRPGSSPNAGWLATLVYFAADVGGNGYAWDPAAPTRADPREYRFYYLPRLHEDRPVLCGDSFWGFVEWVGADVRSWRDPERLAEDGPGIPFEPARVRAKKPPLRREVRRWLARDGGRVLALARSIRDGGRGAAFSALADALEAAGCTNADVLDSCRLGDPEWDGRWVLEVLLGERTMTDVG